MSYIQEGFKSWWNLVRFIAYFFSLRISFSSLFAGWQRDTADEREEWWERIILRLILIAWGFIIRSVVIIVGVIALIAAVPFLPILIILPIRLSYERLIRVGAIGKSWAYGNTPTLHKYGQVLYRGADKKIYGRDATIELMTMALSRQEHNNVLLVGAPGSGRETLVAQFAKNVYRGLVPDRLKNKQVIEVPLEGTPEARLEKMLDEAVTAGNVILVLHDPEKYDGMLSRIEPLLAAPELEVIVITTNEKYHSVWKKHEEIIRYFERIELESLKTEDTLAFIRELAAERYSGVKFGEGVFEEIVKRTDELQHQSTQPEKSIHLLENLAVNAKEVTVNDVQRVISEMTGVPVGAIDRDEKQILLNLEEVLRTEIVGQDGAVRDVAAALRRARAGIGSKEKPIGTFLFLGPTGSGKTHTGKTLARHYFGADGSMARFDMSEFALADTASSFIERLAISVEEQPFGLLFLDELEKADRVIWNTLLQVLDEGRLTTQEGRVVSFQNNIIIATSNAGTDFLEQNPESDKKALVQHLVAEHIFSPEFLNRFDDVVVFRPLTPKDAESVARLLLIELNARLSAERGVTVRATDGLIQELVNIGYSKEQGARALRRTVQDKIENYVADAILKDAAPPGTEITIEHL